MNSLFKNLLKDNKVLESFSEELDNRNNVFSDKLISLIREKKIIEKKIIEIFSSINENELIDITLDLLKKKEDNIVFSSQKEDIFYLLEELTKNYSQNCL